MYMDLSISSEKSTAGIGISVFNFKLFLYSKMVLLTIVTNSNPHTLYFDLYTRSKNEATSASCLPRSTIRGKI